jgi:Tol biopolymer transport system component
MGSLSVTIAHAQSSVALPANLKVQRFAFNGTDYAFTYSDTSKSADDVYVRINTQVFGPYKGVGSLSWSADGKLLGYTASDGKKSSFYIGGIKQATPEQGTVSFEWAPKGSNYYLRGTEGTKEFLQFGSERVVLSDTQTDEMQTGMGLRDLSWTPDGKKLYFIYVKGGVTTLYENAKPLETHPYISQLALSPDGKTLAYGVQDQDGEYLYVGKEKRGPIAGGVLSIAWSPDGTKIAYCSDSTQGARTIVVGEESLGTFPSISIIYPKWSPDGKKIFFEYHDKSKHWYIYTTDGTKGPFKNVGYFETMYSPDGAKLTYSAQSLEDPQEWRLFAGDNEFGPFASDASPSLYIAWSWSPDSTSIAYTVSSGQTSALYVDDQQILSHGVSGIKWSADSKYLGYESYVQKQSLSLVLVQGVEYVGAISGTKVAYIKDGKILFK